MKTMKLACAIAAPLLTFAWTVQSHADTAAAPKTCKDGTASTAAGKGACSGHGGVQKAATTPQPSGAAPTTTTAPAATAASKPAATPAPSGAMSAASPAATSAAGSPPTGATAKCKDGSFSKSKSHTGACSKHGGVDSWL